MEFVHCPLCGKPNPVENKFCDFCLGHLKPGEQTSADISEQPLSGTEDNRHGLGGREKRRMNHLNPASQVQIRGSQLRAVQTD